MRNWRAWSLAAALTLMLAATASACASIWGFQDAVDGADSASDPSATPCRETCVTEPPAGWLGPLEIFEGTGAPPPTPPECATPYPTRVYDGFASPSVSPAI